MREKRRYLLLQFQPLPSNEEEAKHLAYEAIFQLVGEYGASKANPQLKDFDAKNGQALLRCSNAMSEQVIAALALKRKSKAGADVAIRVLKVSGSASQLVPRPHSK